MNQSDAKPTDPDLAASIGRKGFIPYVIQPSSKIQKVLLSALRKAEQSPDLSPEEVAWVRQFVVHLITEISVRKSKDEEPMAA